MSELQEFVEHIQTWHANQMRQLKTILDAPKDTEIRLGADEDAIVLTGEKADGFRMGIVVAQSFLGKLPFSVETNDPDEDDDLAGRNLDMVKGVEVIDTATGLPKACASDCSTNNRGCPELLGPCDCKD